MYIAGICLTTYLTGQCIINKLSFWNAILQESFHIWWSINNVKCIAVALLVHIEYILSLYYYCPPPHSMHHPLYLSLLLLLFVCIMCIHTTPIVTQAGTWIFSVGTIHLRNGSCQARITSFLLNFSQYEIFCKVDPRSYK